MLGNFSVGDYFKQGAAEYAWELSTQGFGLDPEQHLDHRLRRRRGARPRPRRGGDRVLARDRHARRADRAASAARTTSGSPGPTGPVRAVLGALPRPRARRSAPRTTGPGDDTERFLEFWNLVFMQYELHEDGSLTDAAAEEHRHRHGARADGGDPPGRRVGLRDRPSPAAGRARRGAVRAARTGQDDATTRALRRARRPRARRRRSCSPTAWCPRTRSAATCCAGSCAATMHQGRVLGIDGAVPARDLSERVGGGDGRRLPRAAARVADDRALGARRGGGLRPHARAGRAAAGRADRAGQGASGTPGSRRRTPSGSTTPTASPTR